MLRRSSWVLATALVMLLARIPGVHAQVSGWAGSSSPAVGSGMGRGQTRVLELFGQVGLQEGVVAGDTGASDQRSPLALKPLIGLNFHEIAHTRIMVGVTLAFPFSLEMGFGHDISQVAVAPGVLVSRRECASWGWYAGAELPVVITPERIVGAQTEALFGVSLRGGASWYFTAGFGVFAEMNMDLYFGDSAAFVFGGTAGIVVSYEMFRYGLSTGVPAGGAS